MFSGPPTKTDHAVAYVLDNHRKHAREHGRAVSGPDWFSSAVWRVCLAPTTWLLASARSPDRRLRRVEQMIVLAGESLPSRQGLAAKVTPMRKSWPEGRERTARSCT